MVVDAELNLDTRKACIKVAEFRKELEQIQSDLDLIASKYDKLLERRGWLYKFLSWIW
jgi:uncharacterized coiled-coil DUF342 family protein